MDFVITWVNGNDPEWQQEYLRAGGDSIAPNRFRDWDNLHFWFRGVEKFAPWVNKIHFVTWGHLPNWLNVNHPKLNIVKHTDYIPSKYLPTFNSHTIELNFDKIKNLNDEYVYFNDDMFIIDKISPNDFFRKGKPCDMAATIIGEMRPNNSHSLILLRNTAILNRHFSNKDKCMLRHPSNWFNMKYDLRTNFRNLILLIASRKNHTGFKNFHIPQPHLKSTLALLWKKEFEVLNESCTSTFRNNYTDVNPYLQREWNLATNNFSPINTVKLGSAFGIDENNKSDIFKFIRSKEKPLICINDNENINDFENIKIELNVVFNEMLPNKSSYEV